MYCGGHRWRSLRFLVCLIRLVGHCWRLGEGQGGHCCRCCKPSRPPPPPHFPFWSMSFLTIDSSLNNHYSQLDMKWVDPAVPLITQSIGDHKIPVIPPEGSISKKSGTLTESQEIMILRGQPVQEEHTPLLDSSLYTQ